MAGVGAALDRRKRLNYRQQLFGRLVAIDRVLLEAAQNDIGELGRKLWVDLEDRRGFVAKE